MIYMQNMERALRILSKKKKPLADEEIYLVYFYLYKKGKNKGRQTKQYIYLFYIQYMSNCMTIYIKSLIVFGIRIGKETGKEILVV